MTEPSSQSALPTASLSAGRRTPRGKRRWYLVHAPNSEQATCKKLQQAISSDLLEEAFVMRKERWRKQDGAWVTYTTPMYQDYFFIVTKDANGLEKALAELSFSVDVAKGEGGHFAPIAEEAQVWYERALDSEHVIRNSTGVIIDGELHVHEGPLVGQEAHVVKVNRHRRDCMVEISDGAGSGHTEYLPMEIPFKS